MAPQPDPNLANLGTPENCVADFCLIPVLVPYLFQLRLHGFRSNHTSDRHHLGLSVRRGCRSSAIDAEE